MAYRALPKIKGGILTITQFLQVFQGLPRLPGARSCVNLSAGAGANTLKGLQEYILEILVSQVFGNRSGLKAFNFLT